MPAGSWEALTDHRDVFLLSQGTDWPSRITTILTTLFLPIPSHPHALSLAENSISCTWTRKVSPQPCLLRPPGSMGDLSYSYYSMDGAFGGSPWDDFKPFGKAPRSFTLGSSLAGCRLFPQHLKHSPAVGSQPPATPSARGLIPHIHMAASLTSLRYLLKCHLLKEVLLGPVTLLFPACFFFSRTILT